MEISIRNEQPGDEPAIHDLTRAAFLGRSYSDGTEQMIVDAIHPCNSTEFRPKPRLSCGSSPTATRVS